MDSICEPASSIRHLTVSNVGNTNVLYHFRKVKTLVLSDVRHRSMNMDRNDALTMICTEFTDLTLWCMGYIFDDELETISRNRLPAGCVTFEYAYQAYPDDAVPEVLCSSETFQQLVTLRIKADVHENDSLNWSALSYLNQLRTLDMQQLEFLQKSNFILPCLLGLEVFYAPYQLPMSCLRNTSSSSPTQSSSSSSSLCFPNLLVLGLRSADFTCTVLPPHTKLRQIEFLRSNGVNDHVVLWECVGDAHLNGVFPVLQTIVIEPNLSLRVPPSSDTSHCLQMKKFSTVFITPNLAEEWNAKISSQQHCLLNT